MELMERCFQVPPPAPPIYTHHYYPPPPHTHTQTHTHTHTHTHTYTHTPTPERGTNLWAYTSWDFRQHSTTQLHCKQWVERWLGKRDLEGGGSTALNSRQVNSLKEQEVGRKRRDPRNPATFTVTNWGSCATMRLCYHFIEILFASNNLFGRRAKANAVSTLTLSERFKPQRETCKIKRFNNSKSSMLLPVKARPSKLETKRQSPMTMRISLSLTRAAQGVYRAAASIPSPLAPNVSLGHAQPPPYPEEWIAANKG